MFEGILAFYATLTIGVLWANICVWWQDVQTMVEMENQNERLR